MSAAGFPKSSGPVPIHSRARKAAAMSNDKQHDDVYVVVEYNGPIATFVETEDANGRGLGFPVEKHPKEPGLHRIRIPRTKAAPVTIDRVADIEEMLHEAMLAEAMVETLYPDDDDPVEVVAESFVADVLPGLARHVAARLAAQPVTAVVEWGVKSVTTGGFYWAASREDAQRDIDWTNDHQDPNPNATKFPRVLVKRHAATEWVEVN